MAMLRVNDRGEGEQQQTKAIHPGKSIVHNIGFRLCSANCTHADTHARTHAHTQREIEIENGWMAFTLWA